MSIAVGDNLGLGLESSSIPATISTHSNAQFSAKAKNFKTLFVDMHGKYSNNADTLPDDAQESNMFAIPTALSFMGESHLTQLQGELTLRKHTARFMDTGIFGVRQTATLADTEQVFSSSMLNFELGVKQSLSNLKIGVFGEKALNGNGGPVSEEQMLKGNVTNGSGLPSNVKLETIASFIGSKAMPLQAKAIGSGQVSIMSESVKFARHNQSVETLARKVTKLDVVRLQALLEKAKLNPLKVAIYALEEGVKVYANITGLGKQERENLQSELQYALVEYGIYGADLVLNNNNGEYLQVLKQSRDKYNG